MAAINRFRTVIENYQTTTHVPEALHRLTESYLALGMTEEAQPRGGRARLQLPGQRLVQAHLRAAQGQEPGAAARERSWLRRLF